MPQISLGRGLADVEDIFHQAVVAEELLLEERDGETYRAVANWAGKFPCPYTRYKGELTSGWMMRPHFRDVHPLDFVELPSEGFFPRCEWCGMQCNLSYPTHINTKECRAGTACRHQQDMAIHSALAFHQLFSINNQVLERVEVF